MKKEVMTFQTKLADESTAKWHNIPTGSVIVELVDPDRPGINPGWFPTDLVSGVTNHRYNGIIPGESEQTVFIGSNLGSFSIATTNPKRVIEILTANGYKQINT